MPSNNSHERRSPTSRAEIILSNKANVGLLPTACPVAETAISGALSASAGIDMTGGLVNYIATRAANAQLDKIRRPMTDALKAMKLDSDTLAILSARIDKLEAWNWLMQCWKLDAHNEDPESVVQNGMPVREVKEVSVKVYDQLKEELPALRKKVQGFIDRGGKARERDAETSQLCGEFNSLSDRYKFLEENVDAVMALRRNEETEVFADVMEDLAHTCSKVGPCDCIAIQMNKDPNGPRTRRVEIAPGIWAWEGY
ncbi:hypothetical protein BU26DRAFT_513000 [Trematosphaeria pertusa]|uniref:Uncharacterized protein n=1 Tax=Trematosphaeria pertusa TaxID=390896 RepID=A0A6A6J0U5_9PLEO|nr:uncharacterized protein BU26DRAFT_513000 [Trematosphaeria pertusa]KAF2256138.1 hypothetical protein BU26DRAFT_513000 [Trematosphaeria pertusa]